MTTTANSSTPTTTPVTPRPTDPRLAQLRAQVAARMDAADAAERPEVTWDDLTPAQQAAVRRRVAARYARMLTRQGVRRIVRADGSPLSTPPAPAAPLTAAADPADLPDVPAHALLAVLPSRVLHPLPRGRQRATTPTAAAAAAPPATLLQRWRQERGWSQRDLAAIAGVSRGLVAEVERGARRASPASGQRMARALGHPDWQQEMAASQEPEPAAAAAGQGARA